MCTASCSKGGNAASLPENMQAATSSTASFSPVIEQVKQGVVFIEVRNRKAQKKQGDPALQKKQDIKEIFQSTERDNSLPDMDDIPNYDRGSGFIIKPDGFIVTNNHVIKNAQTIMVTLTDKRRFPARVIGTDARSDIGLIKIDAPGKPLDSIPLGNSDTLKAGEWVLAFGSPYPFIQTVTAGIISATGRNTLGISDYEDFIQTDAAINPGNSGGPLVNMWGKVIGMNTAFITQTGGYMGVGFAIPVNMVEAVTRQLLAHGKVTRGWIGVALKDTEYKQLQQNITGAIHAAYIIDVTKNSPADQVHLKPGDLLDSFNGIALHGAADLRNRVAQTMPGSEVRLGYVRHQQHFIVTVQLGTLN